MECFGASFGSITETWLIHKNDELLMSEYFWNGLRTSEAIVEHLGRGIIDTALQQVLLIRNDVTLLILTFVISIF